MTLTLAACTVWAALWALSHYAANRTSRAGKPAKTPSVSLRSALLPARRPFDLRDAQRHMRIESGGRYAGMSSTSAARGGANARAADRTA